MIKDSTDRDWFVTEQDNLFGIEVTDINTHLWETFASQLKDASFLGRFQVCFERTVTHLLLISADAGNTYTKSSGL